MSHVAHYGIIEINGGSCQGMRRRFLRPFAAAYGRRDVLTDAAKCHTLISNKSLTAERRHPGNIACKYDSTQ